VSARLLSPESDPIRPDRPQPLTLTLDGDELTGVTGQTIAGIALAAGRLSWRRTSVRAQPRGLFCGIGVCFDCIVTVNGERDVRACQRRAQPGDVITTQHDDVPEVIE